MTRNQVQILYIIKCIEDLKVTLPTHVAHPIIIVWI